MKSDEVKKAHELLDAAIEDEGPFDGVIGFSQGAALALSYLLQHEIERPHESQPFRFAVFFSGFIPISPDPDFGAEYFAAYSKYYAGRPMLEAVEEVGAKHTKAPKHRAALLLPGKKAALVKEVVDAVWYAAEAGAASGLIQRRWDDSKGVEGFPRVFHPLAMKERVSIPTVHVIGRADPFHRHVHIPRRLCCKSLARVVEHPGGHEVPRAAVDLRMTVAAVEWAVERTRFC